MKKRSVLVLAILLPTLWAAAGTADPLFGGRFDFATGTYPYAVAIGDLNGDGVPDLATANYGSGTASVLLGNGNGLFAARADFAAGTNPRFVAIGDLNGDGKPDMVLARPFSARVSVLLGNGNGTFGARTEFTTGTTPYSVAIGDLDRDGNPDLAVPNSGGSTVSVLAGNGDGTFRAKTDFPTGSSPRSVAIGDLNRDGNPDLAVAGGVGVSVLLGNGNGTFGAKTDHATGSQPTSVTIGDLNADGNPDLVVANYTSNTVSVLLGDGTGAFGARTDYATGLGPFAVLVGDLNGDGSPDLAVANSSSNTVSVLLGAGNGSFGPKSDFATGVGPFSVATGDLERDGKLDLAVANYGSNTVSVMLSQLAPSATSLGSSPNPSRAGQLATLTATVTPGGATGTVTFRDGADSLGAATLSGGVATLTTSSLGLGDHSLTAAYGGNGALTASVSPAHVHAVVPLDSTTMVLKLDPTPSAVGQYLLLTAFVSPASATGSVVFRSGGTPIASRVLTNGVAMVWGLSLCGGTYSLSADYAGDADHLGSSSPAIEHVVSPAPTTVTVVSSPNPSRLAQAVSFTATVTDSTETSCALTGTVQFVVDGAPAGSPVALSGGSATLGGITGLAVGTHGVLAVYAGNASFQGGTSPTITQEVESPRPVLVGVRDLVNDQGGHVKLLWNASYLDLAPYQTIESYWILRSAPSTAVARAALAGARVSRPGQAPDAQVGAFLAVDLQGTTYYWEYIGSQPALHAAGYDYVTATTCDSVAGSNPFTAFMVMARTAGGAQWWFSDPDSGYSVDNLAPGAPTKFTGTYSAGVATLHWDSDPEPDLGLYRLHRGATADFVPGPGNLVAARPDTGYVDAAGSLYHYKLCAVDVHGNPSGFTALLPTVTADVPGDAPLAFALEGVRPNPSRGEQLSVAFTLPTSAPARIELVDVSGRRVAEREVGTLGAGRHSVALAAGRQLAPGLYLVRLTQGADVRVTRAAVLR